MCYNIICYTKVVLVVVAAAAAVVPGLHGEERHLVDR